MNILHVNVLCKAEGQIKVNPQNYLGVDERGTVHWRQMPLLPPLAREGQLPKDRHVELLPLHQYDKIIVSFSGGKDSLSMVLHLLDLGVPKEKIELWHQLVDGAPGSPSFMDWPVTEAYVRAVAKHLGLALRFQWKEGGFEREMLRHEEPTAPTTWEQGEATATAGGKGKPGTRGKFPQVSGNLMVRWCSAYLKIDVARKVFSNDPRFSSGKFLFLTGERREESSNRAKYDASIDYGSTKERRVDQWRPVLDWQEQDVWDKMKLYGIRPHPAYELGFGRLSCMACIFGNKDQWATVRAIAREQFDRIAAYEKAFGVTIKRKGSVGELADTGTPHVEAQGEDLVKLALGHEYPVELLSLPADQWTLPPGAFKKDGGPT